MMHSTKMADQERIRELEQLVRYHADLYYNDSKPEISDAEFDALVDALVRMAFEEDR